MEKEKELVGVGTVSFNIGIFTIVYSWLLLIIPALAIQGIFNLNVDDFKYQLIFMPFQIIAAFLGNKIAVKKAIKGIDIDGNFITTFFLSVFISASIIFVIQILIGIGALVPFNSILGFIIILITYMISNYILLKKAFK